MARAPLKPCPGRCGALIPRARRACPTCAAQREAERGSQAERGYGREHKRLRAWWAPQVERGEVDCANPVCLEPTRRIMPGTPWDLGHTEDRSTYRGPEHARCNRGEAGRTSNAHR